MECRRPAGNFGAVGWLSVVGDWNGDNTTEIGVYQNGNWYLDNNGNGVWDTGDKNYGFGYYPMDSGRGKVEVRRNQ